LLFFLQQDKKSSKKYALFFYSLISKKLRISFFEIDQTLFHFFK